MPFTNLFGQQGGSTTGQAQAPAQGVPAGVDTEANSRANAAAASDIFKTLTSPLDPSTIVGGMMPGPTGPQMQAPPSLGRPIKEWQNLPMDTREVVGAGNARARGISNAITGVANVVGQTITIKKQQDQDKLASSTQRLLVAQDAINNAQQYMQHASPEQKVELQKIIDKNQNLQEKMLDDDPKLRKQLETGLNISFTDPSKNTKDEHKGVMKAFDIFRKNKQQQQPQQPGQSPNYAGQLRAQMPEGAGPDPVRQMQMNLAVKQKEYDYKLAQSYIGRMMTAKDNMDRLLIHEGFANARFIVDHRFRANDTEEHLNAMADRQRRAHDYRVKEINQMLDGYMSRVEAMNEHRSTDPVAIAKMQVDVDKTFGTMISGIDERLIDKENRYAEVLNRITELQRKWLPNEADKAEVNRLQGERWWIEQELGELRSMKSDFKENYDKQKDYWSAYGRWATAKRGQKDQGGKPNAPAPAGTGTEPAKPKPSALGPPISSTTGPDTGSATGSDETASEYGAFVPPPTIPSIFSSEFYGSEPFYDSGISLFQDNPTGLGGWNEAIPPEAAATTYREDPTEANDPG